MEIEVLIEKWPLPNPLRIMGRTYTEIELVATIMRDVEFEGCSEAAGIDYLGETPANIAADIASLHEVFGAGMDRARRPSGGRRLEFPNN